MTNLTDRPMSWGSRGKPLTGIVQGIAIFILLLGFFILSAQNFPAVHFANLYLQIGPVGPSWLFYAIASLFFAFLGMDWKKAVPVMLRNLFLAIAAVGLICAAVYFVKSRIPHFDVLPGVALAFLFSLRTRPTSLRSNIVTLAIVAAIATAICYLTYPRWWTGAAYALCFLFGTLISFLPGSDLPPDGNAPVEDWPIRRRRLEQ